MLRDRLRRLREEGGFQLVELLIAMTILGIGIMAIVAGFSSGMVALTNAGRASTAAALADKQMERCRRLQYATIKNATDTAPGGSDPAFFLCKAGTISPLGPDGRSYPKTMTVTWSCPVGTPTPASPAPPPAAEPTCSGSVASRAVILIGVSVSDPVTGRVLVRESSTFDQALG